MSVVLIVVLALTAACAVAYCALVHKGRQDDAEGDLDDCELMRGVADDLMAYPSADEEFDAALAARMERKWFDELPHCDSHSEFQFDCIDCADELDAARR